MNRNETISKKNKHFSSLQEKMFLYSNFNVNVFIKFLMEHLYTNKKYSLLFRVGFNSNSIHYMLGSQLGLTIGLSHNITHYQNIYNVIKREQRDKEKRTNPTR